MSSLTPSKLVPTLVKDLLRPLPPPAPSRASSSFALPENLYLTNTGATEELVRLRVNPPEDYAPPNREIKKLLMTYLPQKVEDGLAHPCAVSSVLADITWDNPQFASDIERAKTAYRAHSKASGRLDEHTEKRLSTVISYADALRQGAIFPPILLYHDGSQLLMLDGARRVLSVLFAGRTRVEAILAVRCR